MLASLTRVEDAVGSFFVGAVLGAVLGAVVAKQVPLLLRGRDRQAIGLNFWDLPRLVL